MKERFLFEYKERIILQNLGGICRDKSWETKVGILTESNAPRMSTKVATKNSLSLKEWYILPIKVERHSIVPIPFLNAKRFEGKIELCSNHQSSRVLSIYSKVLHRAEERAIGRKEVLEFGLGIGITLYDFQVNGIWLVVMILFKTLSKKLRALEGRCFNIMGDILSRPEAIERREDMA